MIFLLAWMLAAAGAAEGPEEGFLVAVEAVPDAAGGLGNSPASDFVRVREAAWMSADLKRGWRVTASGDLSVPGMTPDESRLHRAAIQWDRPRFRARLGRFVHLGPTGAARVDGLAGTVGDVDGFGAEAWAGRVGPREALEATGDFGAAASLRYGPQSRRASAGWGMRYTASNELVQRGHAAGSLRSASGGWATAMAELGSPDRGEGSVGIRAALAGSVPVLRKARVGATARWEGMGPLGVPTLGQTVAVALAPNGYGVARASGSLDLDALRLSVRAGPSLVRRLDAPLEVGAGGQLSVEEPHTGIGVKFGGASIGTSAYVGGGLSAQRSISWATLSTQSGLYRFRGLDGMTAWVTETQVLADVRLTGQSSRIPLHLGLRAAGGKDRVLSPWVRTGASLRMGFPGGGRQ
jgi:hypothetical protein